MPLPDTDRPRRDRPYVSSRTLAAANRIFDTIDDPAVPAPRSPPPTLPLRGQAVFERIMTACRPGHAALDEVLDVRAAAVQPPPPRKRRRR